MEALKKTSLKKLMILILIQFFAVALIVWIFDPFYQYHAPFFHMEAVLNDRDNQMPGTIRNFDYDSVLVGSSVAENFDSSFLDEAYDCRTLKIIRASGSLADLNYYLDMAQEERELRNVFWCLDIFAVSSDLEVTLYGEDIPRYLHTETVLDDLPYLYNKEILLEKIPYMLACSAQRINTGGQAYNWSRGKEFSAEQAMRFYERDAAGPDTIVPQKDFSERVALIEQNVALLREQIQSHPDTDYYILLPPYSMLWWDCAYLNGELEERFYILERLMSTLPDCENVKLYFFQNESDIVCNLDNYMDMIHYSPGMNQFMLDKMAADENRVTKENRQMLLEDMRALTEHIEKEEIYRYYH
ncbi:MAG: SGNH/GDSL hydrolase family protein [Acetatifactor sp.]